jgi:hypothetical protein
MAAKWPTVTITTPEGAKDGVAPLVISASRATDIPAFHAQWLIDRLQAGYCIWTNPFNSRPQYVSFEKARAFVFWTKNARPLMEHLHVFDQRRTVYYFQFTLNDYEAEGLEPNVPPLEQRVRTFIELSRQIGRERVIWRFDPLILADNITVESLAAKVQRLGDRLHEYMEKLVISFADVACYAKVKRNLGKWGGGAREFSAQEIHDMAGRLAEMAKGWGIQIATCSEPADLAPYGITHNRCIDGDLLLRVSNNDPELVQFLRPRGTPARKDPSQREHCGCAPSKDIGAYNTCPHGCAYCYANASPVALRPSAAQPSAHTDAIRP